MSLNEKREREEIKQSTIDNFFPIKKRKKIQLKEIQIIL